MQNHYSSSTWPAMYDSIYVKRGFLCSHHFFWSTTFRLQHGFPVPEERYKAWTPLERQTVIMFCEGGKTGSLSSSVQDDVTFLSSAKHYASVSSALFSLMFPDCTLWEKGLQAAAKKCYWMSCGLVKNQTKLVITQTHVNQKLTGLISGLLLWLQQTQQIVLRAIVIIQYDLSM